MTKFIVKGAVKYAGKNYTSGSVVDVDEKHVDEFKSYGWEIVDEEPAKEPEEGQDQDGQDADGEGEGQEGEGQEGGEGDPQPVDYTKLTNEQLRDLLDQKEIKYAMNYNKAQLIALLEG